MKKKKTSEEQSMIGRIIDLPLADFEKELVLQKVNIGTINNLILNLTGAYNELRVRKDSLIEMSFKDQSKKADIDSAIQGLYSEMVKIEQKITYLRQRSGELIDVG